MVHDCTGLATKLFRLKVCIESMPLRAHIIHLSCIQWACDLQTTTVVSSRRETSIAFCEKHLEPKTKHLTLSSAQKSFI